MGFWNKEEEKKKAGEINGLAKTEPAPSANLQPAVTSGGLMTEQGLAPERSLSKDPLTTRFGTIRSALSEGTVIQGKLTFDTPVRIDGKLSGEIFSSEALIVGEKGSIDAQVEVNALIVMGRVKGDIIAKERVELMAGGVIEATLNTPCFVMEEGAR
ncbi:MAG: polymer-forming cytoskeletal protein, partial [Bdellovibrionales bacterium]|nr:polymer-forming cytoskeletal protein [Bdellovibrionales bacterium]